MAEAGGFALTPKACTTDTDCGGGDTCDTTAKTCRRRFYQAGNQAELAAALDAISKVVQVGDPCEIKLEPALGSDPYKQELIVVYINGDRQAPGTDTWTLVDAVVDGVQSQLVKFQGAMCQRIKSSTAIDPVDIEVRAVQAR
jgi:hypothetical protein